MTNAASSPTSLQKILLPITTPFHADGIDHSALRANIDRWSTTGIGGYVILGSTGERVHLDDREYLEVIETTRELVPPSLAFIVGAGQQSVVGTVNEIQRAAKRSEERRVGKECR